jgi:parallel beta-helix repeat protein
MLKHNWGNNDYGVLPPADRQSRLAKAPLASQYARRTMNRRCRIVWLFTACFLLVANFLLAQTPTTDWSIAALDGILTNVPPGQATVKIDDMEILVSNLRAWRNRLAGLPQPKLAFDGISPLWTGGNVYYTFDASVSAEKQRAVLDGAAEWATFANLHFIPRSTEPNYITFRQNDFLGGGQSAVGMIGGQQFTEFGPYAWNRPTVCHEIGHALGLIHEHQRSDRDSYVTILTTNINSFDLPNFTKLTDSQNQSAYDFLSIMHYARNALSIDPATRDTIEPFPQYSSFLNVMGSKFDPVLSASDRAGMAAIYGAGPPLTNVVSNTQDSGPGSLRATLYYALDHPGTTITFNIPTNDPAFSNGVFTILLTDVLPSILNNTVIDATTQPDNAPANRNVHLTSISPPIPGTYPCALHFHGTNSAVKGLFITGAPAMGILIDQGACSNIIGGPLSGDRNIISGNGQQGIAIFDFNSIGNVVRGNFIGLDTSGNAALSNAWEAVGIYNGTRGNVVIGNVISGNGAAGVRIGGAHNNTVQGNLIGVNASGTVALPNGWHGVGIYDGSQSNLVGGPLPGQLNVISGNSQQGVIIADTNSAGNVVQGNYIGLDAAGASSISNNWEGIAIFNGARYSMVAGNIISGNGAAGVAISGPGTDNNVVQGNYIGLDAPGSATLPNQGPGAVIYSSSKSNLVGGILPAQRNVISGNMQQGVAIADPDTIGNTVSGNYIGLNPAGTAAMSNKYAGISIFNGASSNIIGGLKAKAGNVISGNGGEGLTIDGSDTTDNCVWGNFIGLNAAGDAAVSNAWSGIAIFNGARSTLIGGKTIAQRNVISGNAQQGVVVADASTSGNVISGNYIGLNASGTAAIPNVWVGVNFFSGSHDNLVGGAEIGAGNLICGNTGPGIIFQSPETSHNAILGNFIGMSPAGSIAIPNGSGIGIWDGAQLNQVGGVNAGEANVIANNQSDGVQLFDPSTMNNAIRGNSIFGNNGTGIALYNGANLSSPSPSLTSAVLTTNTTVSGSLSSLANTLFQIDFYSSPASPAQGMIYLGTRSVMTDPGGFGGFSTSLAAPVPAGRIITATATDNAGNTSSMSTGVAVTTTSTVNDTVPDSWRELYFGGNGTTTNGQSCATCDPDQDGVNNLQEFLAGTNPTNALSLPRLSAFRPNSSNTVAGFLSSTGIVYQVQTRDDLANGFWTIAENQILGTGTNVFIVDPNPSPIRRFYRLQVLW